MSGNSSSYIDPFFWETQECVVIFFALFIGYILLIPLLVFVLYLGYHRWRNQRSGSTSETSSHSDIITYNMAVMELISILGSFFYLDGVFGNLTAMYVALYLWEMILIGQNLFHVLTCVDRYLAVVRPVTYLGLKQSGGVRIRNITIGCIWLICFGFLGLVLHPVKDFLKISHMLLSFIVVCFCSLSVLRVLVQPGPGDVSGNRGRVDQSKKRAFQTIMIILAALAVRLLSSAVNVMQSESMLGPRYGCFMMWTFSWLSWPSSLVLPLLFLHRVGKLPSCKTNTESG